MPEPNYNLRFTFVHSSEMVAHSAHRNWFQIYTFYHVCERHAKSLHTHTTTTHLSSFGVVKLCSLIGEGRRGCEGWLKGENETYDYNRLHWI